MNTDDRQLGDLLGAFLHRELDGQTGRAAQAFAAQADPAHHRPRAAQPVRRRLLLWGLPIAGAPAAAVTVAMALGGLRHAPTAKPLEPRPAVAVNRTAPAVPADADPFPWTPPPGAKLSETVDIHDIDDGVLLANGQVPMRRLRRQTVKTVSWFDERSHLQVEVTVPCEQVVLVAVNPF